MIPDLGYYSKNHSNIYLSDDVSVSLSEMGWSETIILGATIDSSESTNTGVTSHVQVAGQ